MNLSSPAFKQGGAIPKKYTCEGANISPPLMISIVPPEAKALALIVDDPDAPSKTWVHWVLWNIPPATKEIVEGVSAPGVEGMTDFRSPGYGGPCPPSGTHRYVFKVFALDLELDLAPTALKKDLEIAMEGHILAKAELVGTYKRSV